MDRQLNGRESALLVVGQEANSFDVAVIAVGDGITDVNAVAFETWLGTERWVQRLADALQKQFEHDRGVHLGEDHVALRRLREAASLAIAELASVGATTVHLPQLTVTWSGPVDLEALVTRPWFDHLTADLVAACEAPIERAFDEAWDVSRKDVEHVLLIGTAARIPALVSLVRRVSRRQRVNVGVTADTLGATGAMLQAGVLIGEVRDILPLDVLPRTIGIEVEDGRMLTLVGRNTTIPTRQSEIVTTGTDDQELNVNVYQGEHEIAARNTLLASFRLPMPPAPRGLPQVEVTVDVDANGIVLVRAKDLGTGRSEQLTDISGAEPPTVPLFGDRPALFQRREWETDEEPEPPQQQTKS